MSTFTSKWRLNGLMGLSIAMLSTPSFAHTKDALIERGGYLIQGFGCADCHTPLKMGPNGPKPDFSRGLSGHPQQLTVGPAPAASGAWVWGGAGTNTAFWGPWGISYAANLTPDP
ncbi:MAG TPA: hypothetical protein VFM48_10020, partial [Aquabacterium sp.]|nr:hypothetical protein [Aquabacterium sp.]